MAQREHDATLLLGAHYSLGAVLQAVGEPVPARAHFEHALNVYTPRQRDALLARYGADLSVTSRALLALVLWLLGYPDQAGQHIRQALDVAQEIDNPWNTTLAWSMNLVLQQFLHEPHAVQQQADTLSTLSHEHGFLSFWAGTSRRGWALVMQGQEAEGLQELLQGVAAVRATGMELYRSYDLALLNRTTRHSYTQAASWESSPGGVSARRRA